MAHEQNESPFEAALAHPTHPINQRSHPDHLAAIDHLLEIHAREMGAPRPTPPEPPR